MYAGVLHGPGRIEYQEVEMPKISDGEVLVKVKCAGICGSDVSRVMTKGAYRHPLIPGHEFSGVVEDAGKSGISEGQKVAVYPLIPCKSCNSCKSGMFHLCDNYSYLGSRCDGGFAEFVKCPEESIVSVPDEVSIEDAALMEPCSVSLHGVSKAGIKSGDTVLIYGLGTIGIFVAQWARVFGAENIIGIDVDAYKFGIAKKLGVDVCTDTDDITGADAVFECAGTVSTQERCILAAKKRGKIVLLGNSEGDLTIKKENVPLILRKELSIMGSWNSTINEDWKKSISCMQSGMIKSSGMVTHRKKLSEIKNVFLEMHQKSYPYLKINFVL